MVGMNIGCYLTRHCTAAVRFLMCSNAGYRTPDVHAEIQECWFIYFFYLISFYFFTLGYSFSFYLVKACDLYSSRSTFHCNVDPVLTFMWQKNQTDPELTLIGWSVANSKLIICMTIPLQKLQKVPTADKKERVPVQWLQLAEMKPSRWC